MVYDKQDPDQFLSLTIFALSVRPLADSSSDSVGYVCHLFCGELNVHVFQQVVTAFLQ